jgi:hypothetical protein
MPQRVYLTLSLLLLTSSFAGAKDKKKVVLPADVLKAHTVFVMVDPQAGIDIAEPTVNNDARRDVENALLRWGRLDPIQDEHAADLIITVRRGHDKTVDPTIGGTRINNTPGMGQSNRAGGPGFPGDASNGQPPSSQPYPQTEIGATQDVLVVYRGMTEHPLDAPAVWRYQAKDGLESPDVPAVEVFRKLVAESEKQAATHP